MPKSPKSSNLLFFDKDKYVPAGEKKYKIESDSISDCTPLELDFEENMPPSVRRRLELEAKEAQGAKEVKEVKDEKKNENVTPTNTPKIG